MCLNPEKSIAVSLFILFVRLIRLELTRLSAPDPKSGVSTNSTTSVLCGSKITLFLLNIQKKKKKN